MSLNTFGAVLAFAIDLEGTLHRFYDEASKVVGGEADLFAEYARKSGKRRQRLIALRQDNVTEMVLEPINGLNQTDYETMTSTPIDRPSALMEAIRLEERVERFYMDAGPKLNVTELRRTFQKLALENKERLIELGKFSRSDS